jgi:hypothetical protein
LHLFPSMQTNVHRSPSLANTSSEIFVHENIKQRLECYSRFPHRLSLQCANVHSRHQRSRQSSIFICFIINQLSCFTPIAGSKCKASFTFCAVAESAVRSHSPHPNSSAVRRNRAMQRATAVPQRSGTFRVCGCIIPRVFPPQEISEKAL